MGNFALGWLLYNIEGDDENAEIQENLPPSIL